MALAVNGHARSGTKRRLTFAVGAAPVSVQGDRALLEHFVDNLVDNAMRYASAGTVVEITLRESSDCATLRVVDAGEVIDDREVPRLFDRLCQRGSSRSRKTGGRSRLGDRRRRGRRSRRGVSVEALPEDGLAVAVVLPRGDGLGGARRWRRSWWSAWSRTQPRSSCGLS